MNPSVAALRSLAAEMLDDNTAVTAQARLGLNYSSVQKNNSYLSWSPVI